MQLFFELQRIGTEITNAQLFKIAGDKHSVLMSKNDRKWNYKDGNKNRMKKPEEINNKRWDTNIHKIKKILVENDNYIIEE